MVFKKNIFVFYLLFHGIIFCRAQSDVAYDHIMAAATYYNPSFAGANGQTSFSLNFNNNDNKNKPDNNSYFFSMDTYTRMLRGGIGILGNFNQTHNQLKSSMYLGAIYAPKISLENNINISPSLKLGYVYNKDIVLYSADSISFDSMIYGMDDYDISLGLLVNSDRFYAGVSVDHLMQPEVNCFDKGDFIIRRKYIAQFGYHYAWNKNASSIWHLNLISQYQPYNSFIFLNDYFVSKKFPYHVGAGKYYYRLLFGAGYKYKFHPYDEHFAYVGFGVQNHAITLGGGFEFLSTSYIPKTFEISVKYVLNNY